MRILVLIKQVPESSKVKMNPETGTMIRSGLENVVNPLDLYAIETAIRLKEKYGGQVVFWGGGLDTQKVLPFGTPEETAGCVRERLRVFGKGGGFVWNTVHNIQGNIPVENMLAMLDALR